MLASPAVACAARRLAGAAGFEPANAGTKNRCLTTWRRPSRCGREAAYSREGRTWKGLGVRDAAVDQVFVVLVELPRHFDRAELVRADRLDRGDLRGGAGEEGLLYPSNSSGQIGRSTTSIP